LGFQFVVTKKSHVASPVSAPRRITPHRQEKHNNLPK
jgi:hypothetical protein